MYCTNCSKKITKNNRVTHMCWINNMEIWVSICTSCYNEQLLKIPHGDFKLQVLKMEEN